MKCQTRVGPGSPNCARLPGRAIRVKGMILRSVPVIVGVLFSLLAISPVHGSDHEVDSVTVSGTVWIDENVDGIRHPTEPGIPDFMPIIVVGPYFWNSPLTDQQGHFTFEIGLGSSYSRPGEYVRIMAYYLRLGDGPVWETGWGAKYTHFGCGNVSVKLGDPDHTVDIRMVHHYDGGRESPPPQDWPLTDGHFFKQRWPFRSGCDRGFSVTNADGILFWDTWKELGLENVGYPTSSRYVWRGLVTQTFQKAILQWRPVKGVFFVNVFDELYKAGYDDELLVHYSIPKQLPPCFLFVDPVGEEADIKMRRLALLDANPAIRERYYSAPNPLWQYGLPTSKVEDYGNVFVIRTQKAVFQQWKEDVPWAKAGEVTIANGVDIAMELSRREVSDNIEGKIRRIAIHMFSSEEQVRLYQAARRPAG